MRRRSARPGRRSTRPASSQRPTAQRQVSDERGQFDVHTLEDGGEVWFRLLWLAPPAAAQEDEARDAPED